MSVAPLRGTLLRIGRTTWRLCGLGGVLGSAAVGDWIGGRNPAQSLHRLCRRLVRLLSLEVTVSGPVPSCGLIVSNHLGYVDIIVLAAILPVRFVAKQEVAGWPVFGRFARQSGTVFVARDRRNDCARAGNELRSALESGAPVVLFPEGTSTGGAAVLPFKSSLLQPAIDQPIAAVALGYSLQAGEGDPADRVCYWREMTLVPHLIGLLGRRTISARLAFDQSARWAGDRKSLAANLHERVEVLRTSVKQLQDQE